MNSPIKRGDRIVTMVALLGTIPMATVAQEVGRIVGRVLDGETGQPLSSVEVYISAGWQGALTSLDGRYVIRLPAGVHEVTGQNIGYDTKTVTGVEVRLGRATELNLTLTSRAVELEDLVVTSMAERGSTTALLTERKHSAVVSDGIGAEQISRSPNG